MKKIAILFFFIFIGFLGGKIAVRWDALHSFFLPSAQIPSSLRSRFLPTPYPLQNRSFVVIVTGRNNGGWVGKTLSSILSQRYENFRIIYIDDGSHDGSFELARDLIYDTEYLIPTTLIHNEEPLGTVANLNEAIRACSDEEIVVLVDGSDWLSHEWVLEKLNQYYANSDLWITYGQFLHYPTFKPNPAIDPSLGPFHLQTFYASLFKKIDPSHFTDAGLNLDSSAYMVPMLAMAENHFQSIPDVLYITHSETD